MTGLPYARKAHSLNYYADMAQNARKWSAHYRKESRIDKGAAVVSAILTLMNTAYAVATGHWPHLLLAAFFAYWAVFAIRASKLNAETADKWDQAAATHDSIAKSD